ncbi:MAG: hypothetical protein DRI36_00570 [Caldiserica bacterium]|nr:MAG: hypothetical protein DRI36_00570 [Caldisericota bacterium]
MIEVITSLFLIFMILGALIALESRDLFSSIISIGVVGFILSALFLFLKAPDIAIVQIVIEILTLVILIRATISRDVCFYEDTREFFPFAVNIIFLLLFSIIFISVLKYMPEFGEISSKVREFYLKEGFKKTGAANIVTSVILDFRGYDTLGEATVLFTSILGAVTLLRRRAKNE